MAEPTEEEVHGLFSDIAGIRKALERIADALWQEDGINVKNIT